MVASDLDTLRAETARLAVEMVRLLGERRRLVEKISEIKRSQGVETVQTDVEKSIRQAMLEEAAKHGVPPETVNRLATVVFMDSVEMQSRKGSQLTHMDILRRAVELQKKGMEVHRLEVGEPDLGAPPEVRRSLAEAALNGYARYADSRGIQELREAVVKHLQERCSVNIQPGNVIVTPGGRFAIYLAMKTLLSEGDEVLVIDPSWPMYRQCASFLGVRSIHVRTRLEDGWSPRVDELEDKVSRSTKAILLNYPNNPTGKILDRKTFTKILDFARDRGISVISDEVYSDYSRGGHVSVLDYDGLNYVLVQSFSKSYGMTGYRVGYVVASETTVSKMASVIGLVMTCVPEFIQHSALKALTLKDTPNQYAEIMMRRMDTAVSELQRIKTAFYKPDGGMYVFPKINTGGMDGMKFAFDLLESKGVAVAPGSIFGGYDDFVRISLGAPEESIAKGIRLLGEYLVEKGLT
ncbi:MAG: aminotransferase class I/II-fold pyridoxal phosphate-dependent enzyme [Candidatus Caldarchaeum sp.]